MGKINNSLRRPSSPDQISAALALQRAAYFAHPVPALDQRRADLRQLQTFIRDNKDGLVAAVNADYGSRSRHETLFTEIFPAINAVKHTLKHLQQWMKPQRRAVDIRNFLGAKNRVIAQPLGVVGCIVPWNFPIYLSFLPLICIFAAGNRAMVKMSGNSGHLVRFLIEKIPAYFPLKSWRFLRKAAASASSFRS